MKKILTLIILALPFICFSCQDDLDDEQFEKFVLLVKNGYNEYNIEFTESGKVSLPLSVGINGTSKNNEDIKVRIGLDADTLKGYNKDKYKDETSLYNEIFPLGNFSLTPADSTITIQSGHEHAAFTVELTNLNALPDKYAEYILPLSIKDASGYRIAKDDHSKILMRIIFSNSFSGVYTGAGKVKEDGGGETDIGTKTLYAVNFNECFTYAGNIDPRNPDRDKYIVHIKIDENENVTMSAPNPEIELNLQSSSVEYTYGTDPNDKRKLIVTTLIKLKYQYKDLTTPEFPLQMTFDGSLSNTRTVYIDQ